MARPSIQQQASDFKELTRDRILDILMHNKMYGYIECGWRCWLHSFISLPYKHPLEMSDLNVCGYIRDLTYESEGISCYPSEQDVDILDSRIRQVANHLYKMHTNLLNTKINLVVSEN